MKKAHLTREQRYTISAMHKQGCTQKMIAPTPNNPAIPNKIKIAIITSSLLIVKNLPTPI